MLARVFRLPPSAFPFSPAMYAMYFAVMLMYVYPQPLPINASERHRSTRRAAGNAAGSRQGQVDVVDFRATLSLPLPPSRGADGDSAGGPATRARGAAGPPGGPHCQVQLLVRSLRCW